LIDTNHIMGTAPSKVNPNPSLSEKHKSTQIPSLSTSFSQLSIAEQPLSSVSPSFLSSARHDFESDPKNLLASTLLSKSSYDAALISRRATIVDQPVYNYKISLEGSPITNQKSSGRCWIFACMNVARISLMKKLGIEELQ
jgi:bleomycin hydrolase